MPPPTPLERLATGLMGRRFWVLAVASVLTALAVWGTAKIDILTSRKALLNRDAEVSKRLDDYLRKFGSASDLIVVVEGAKRPDLEEYASALARKLEQQPKIRAANERVDLVFFLEHAYLMVPPDILERFSSLVDELIGQDPPGQINGWQDAWRRAEDWLEDPPDLANVDMDLKSAEESLHLMFFLLEQWQRWLDSEATPKSLAWNTMLARHGAEALASGYFASRDGRMLFVFVRPDETSEEFEQVKPFIETVRAVAADLAAEWRAAGRTAPKIGLTGIPAATYEEFLAIKHDILFTISTAVGLILLLILAWLRSVRWALVVFIPMALGVVWNTGLAYLLLGHLTIITSGFTAILFGLGVDYGIFMSTRIIEERARQPDLVKAIAAGTAASARALLTAGGATVLIFASLALVEFDGFAELGLVAACGVGLVLVSTFALQPIVFRLLPPKVSPRQQAATGAPPETGVKIRQPLNVMLVLVALLAAGAGGAAAFGIPFNYDVISLLPADSEAGLYQRRMLEESDYQGEVVIFTADSIEEARRMTAAVEKLPAIARVNGVTDLFPPDAAERAERARRIGRLVDESAYARRIRALGRIELSPKHDARIDSALEKIQTIIEDAQEQAFSAGHKHLVAIMEKILTSLENIQAKRKTQPGLAHERTRAYLQTMLEAGQSALGVLKAWRKAAPLTPADLPAGIRDRFFAPDGTVAFYAFPAGNIYDHAVLTELMKEVYSVSKTATGFPTTHASFSRMVVGSFRNGTIMAALVAILWIGLVLRRLRSLIIASLPLLVGGGWMMGIMAATGTEFNFANIIALPLMMGLAVDYGVWFAHRQHDFPQADGWAITRLAGKAILLAAGTTLAGLGAITLASYRGISSMGVAITIGLLCCVAAALLISPAITQLMFRRKK